LPAAACTDYIRAQIAQARIPLSYIPPGAYVKHEPEVDASGTFARQEATYLNLPEPHLVDVPNGLLVGRAEVTQGEWLAAFDENPSTFSCGSERPVESVNWFEALAFANTISERDGYEACYRLKSCTGTPGAKIRQSDGWDNRVEGPEFGCSDVEFVGRKCSGYRLLTDDEWEYVARHGQVAILPNPSAGDWIRTRCNVPHNECSVACDAGVADWPCLPTDVLSTRANADGLTGIGGNVAEWVWDAHADGRDGGDPFEITGMLNTDEPLSIRRVRGMAYTDCAGGWDAVITRLQGRHALIKDSAVGFRLARAVQCP
jgi:formylglycine-generating enzyme required for sulfatase activity